MVAEYSKALPGQTQVGGTAHSNPPLLSSPSGLARLHPARPYYLESFSFRMAVWSGLIALVWGTSWVLYLLAPWDVEFLTYGPFTIAGDSWPSPPIMLAMFFVCIMFSLVLEPSIPRTLRNRLFVGLIYFLVYSFFIASSGLYRVYSNYERFDEAWFLLDMVILGIFVIYIVLCAVMVHRDQIYVCMRVWRDIRLYLGI